jgi:uncharacterized protein YoxC
MGKENSPFQRFLIIFLTSFIVHFLQKRGAGYKCKICDKVHDKYYMEDHLVFSKDHLKNTEVPFFCHQCDIKLKNIKHATLHQQKHHGGREVAELGGTHKPLDIEQYTSKFDVKDSRDNFNKRRRSTEDTSSQAPKKPKTLEGLLKEVSEDELWAFLEEREGREAQGQQDRPMDAQPSVSSELTHIDISSEEVRAAVQSIIPIQSVEESEEEDWWSQIKHAEQMIMAPIPELLSPLSSQESVTEKKFVRSVAVKKEKKDKEQEKRKRKEKGNEEKEKKEKEGGKKKERVKKEKRGMEKKVKRENEELERKEKEREREEQVQKEKEKQEREELKKKEKEEREREEEEKEKEKREREEREKEKEKREREEREEKQKEKREREERERKQKEKREKEDIEKEKEKRKTEEQEQREREKRVIGERDMQETRRTEAVEVAAFDLPFLDILERDFVAERVQEDARRMEDIVQKTVTSVMRTMQTKQSADLFSLISKVGDCSVNFSTVAGQIERVVPQLSKITDTHRVATHHSAELSTMMRALHDDIKANKKATENLTAAIQQLTGAIHCEEKASRASARNITDAMARFGRQLDGQVHAFSELKDSLCYEPK